MPYLNEEVLPNRLIVDEQRRLMKYDFNVLVDSIQLFKPVMLKGNPGGYTTHKIEEQRFKVYGRNLVFSGYLIVQEGAQLRPDELRGIMVRIKNVGIGYYDPSLLDYRFNEGPRSRWLTGEIYVSEGLEDGLNIDRDSFNRFHPEFKAVQEYVHDLLHTKIFPESYRQINIRSSEKVNRKTEIRAEHLKEVISSHVEAPVIIRDDSPGAGETPLSSIKKVGKRVEVHTLPTDTIKTKKPYRQLAAAILALLEVSMQEKTDEKRREVFTKLLLELLEGWQ